MRLQPALAAIRKPTDLTHSDSYEEEWRDQLGCVQTHGRCPSTPTPRLESGCGRPIRLDVTSLREATKREREK